MFYGVLDVLCCFDPGVSSGRFSFVFDILNYSIALYLPLQLVFSMNKVNLSVFLLMQGCSAKFHRYVRH